MGTDCRVYYDNNGRLLPWCLIPGWYVQFLSSSPPDEEIGRKATKEWNRRGGDRVSFQQ